MRRSIAVSLFTLVTLAGCDGDTPPIDGGTEAGALDAGVDAAGPTDAGTCLPSGSDCTSALACCSHVCSYTPPFGPDAAAVNVCR